MFKNYHNDFKRGRVLSSKFGLICQGIGCASRMRMQTLKKPAILAIPAPWVCLENDFDSQLLEM